MNKAKLDFWVDAAIGVAGLASGLSGLILLVPMDLASGILGISLRGWSSFHTWSSLAAIAGVGVHLALHLRWMVAMGRQMVKRGLAPVSTAEPAQARAGGNPLSRRAFLAIGGAAAVVTGLAAAGYKVLAGAAAGDTGQGSSLAASTGQESGVACPRGLLNDPYPGRCHHYVDADGDGICDYSVPGSGSQIAGSSRLGPQAGLPGGPGTRSRP